MTRHYLNPHDSADDHALPTVEIEHYATGEIGPWTCEDCGEAIDAGDHASGVCGHCSWPVEPSEAGYYWTISMPGCLPDTEWSGPFDSASEALAEARDTNEPINPRDGSKLGSERYPLIVDEGWNTRPGSFKTFRFMFGAYGATHVLVRAQGLDSALEAAMDCLADHAPGIFSEAACDACVARFEATPEGERTDFAWGCEECSDGYAHDMTIVSHTTYDLPEIRQPGIPSWEWTVRDATEAERALYFGEID